MLYRTYIWIPLLLLMAACHGNTQKHADSTHNRYTAADSVHVKGILRHSIDVYQQSLDSSLMLMQQAIQYSQRVGYQYGLFISWYNTGYYNYSWARGDAALSAYQNALRYADTAVKKDRQMIPEILQDMGNICADMGQYQQALQYYHQTEQAYIKYGSESVKRETIDNNIATVLMNLTEYTQAMNYLNKAGQEAIDNNNYKTLISIYNNKTEVLTSNQQYDSAEVYALRAIQLAKQYDPGSDRHVMALIATSNLYIDTKQLAKALTYLQQALPLAGEQKKVRVLMNLGATLCNQKNLSKGTSYLLQAEQEAKKLGDVNTLIDVYKTLSEAYTDQQQYRQANSYTTKYAALQDSLRNVTVTENANRLETQYQTAKKDQQIAQKQLLLEKRDKQYWKLLTIAAVVVLVIIIILVVVVLTSRQRQRINRQKIAALEQEKQIKSLRDTIAGEELERKRIAQELHDGVGGTLAMLNLGLSGLRPKLQAEDKKTFEGLLQLLNEASDEIRQTAHNLMPGLLQRLGLVNTLKYYLLQEFPSLKVELMIRGEVDGTPNTFQLIVYRIVQQLVHNIVRHASATHAMVQLVKDTESNVFNIMVEDDGRGFDTSEQPKGIGLQSITDRVRELQGTLSVQSGKEEGTLVIIEFSLDHINTLS